MRVGEVEGEAVAEADAGSDTGRHVIGIGKADVSDGGPDRRPLVAGACAKRQHAIVAVLATERREGSVLVVERQGRRDRGVLDRDVLQRAPPGPFVTGCQRQVRRHDLPQADREFIGQPQRCGRGHLDGRPQSEAARERLGHRGPIADAEARPGPWRQRRAGREADAPIVSVEDRRRERSAGATGLGSGGP